MAALKYFLGLMFLINRPITQKIYILTLKITFFLSGFLNSTTLGLNLLLE